MNERKKSAHLYHRFAYRKKRDATEKKEERRGASDMARNDEQRGDSLIVTTTLKTTYENKINASRQRVSNEILSGVKNSSPTCLSGRSESHGNTHPNERDVPRIGSNGTG